MSLINKLKDAIDLGVKEFGNEYLLGLIELSDEEYIEIKKLSYEFLKGYNYLMLAYKEMVVSVALIQFCIREYKGGEFWVEASNSFDIENRIIQTEGKISLEKFIKSKDLYFHVGKSNRSYVTTILLHSIMCTYSYLKVLEFLKDIYVKDLEEDYIEEEVENLLDYMRKLFSNHIEDDDITYEIKGSKMSIANQQLPKAFRIAFIKSYNIIASLLKKTLKNIHNVNYENEVKYKSESRFYLWFTENKGKLDFTTLTRRGTGHGGGVKKFSLARFTLDDNRLYLNIPKQIIDFNYLTSDVYLEIYNGENIVLVEELELMNYRVTVKTLEVKKELKEFPQKFRYKIVSSGKVIFDSRANLYRNSIIFDELGEEIDPKLLKAKSYCIVTDVNDDIDISEGNVKREYFNGFKKITFTLKDDTVLLINDGYLAINPESIRTQLYSEEEFKNVKFKRAGLEFRLFKERLIFKLRCSCEEDISNFLVEINDFRYSLDEVCEELECKYIFDGTGDSYYTFKLKGEVAPLNYELNILLRRKGRNKTLIEERVILLKDINYNFEKNYYIDEKEARLKFIEIDGFEILGKELEKTYTVNLRYHDKLELSIEREDLIYEAFIDVDILRVGLEEDNLKITVGTRMWWEELLEKRLILKTPFKKNQLIIEIDGKRHIEGYRKKGGLYYFEIGNYINYKGNKKITFSLESENEVIKLFDVYLENHIEDLKANYIYYSGINNGFYASLNFIGKGKLIADLVNLYTKQVEKNYEFHKDNKILDENLRLHFGYYELIIYEKVEDDFFGESESKYLDSIKFIAGDKLLIDLKNKRLKGVSCRCDKKTYFVNNFYIKDFKLVNKKFWKYEGVGFFLKKDWLTYEKKEWFFTQYNPIGFNILDYKDRSITLELVDRNGDGILIDKERLVIANHPESNDYNKFDLIDSIKFEVVD